MAIRRAPGLFDKSREGRGRGAHLPAHPHNFLHDVQARVRDELVHVPRYVCVAEARDAVAACFGGAEGEGEEGVVVGADDGEVIGHFGGIRRELCWELEIANSLLSWDGRYLASSVLVRILQGPVVGTRS